MSSFPVLYSFRRCPYAIRARMALMYARVQVELREVVLRDKPEAMLAASPKATVPVLCLQDGVVLDESLEIMYWAVSQCDPDKWLTEDLGSVTESLVRENDDDFKPVLDRYKYADRYPEFTQQYYRQTAENFLHRLEVLLSENGFLLRNTASFADVAIFPFIRQFAMVDKSWFDNAPYPRLQSWLAYFLDNELFKTVMKKYSPWKEGESAVLFLE